MKRKLINLICVVALTLVCLIVGVDKIVQAAGDYTSINLSITKVDDITVYNDYIINSIPIDNSLVNNQDGCQIYKFTIEKDGFISLLLSARNVKSTAIKNGKISDAKITVTVYRDSMLLYPVAPSVSAVGLTKGESKESIAIDQGTYYVVFKFDVWNNNSVLNYVKGLAEFVLYYEELNSSEIYRPSIAGKENPVSFDTEFIGMLTGTNPKDYYTFKLSDKALVKLNFLYGSTKKAKFVLYSPTREELVTKTVDGNSVWYNIEKFLEPGTYYCSFETLTAYDGGQTNLIINQTVYPLKLTQTNYSVNSYVSIDTIDNPKEVRYILGKTTNSELQSPKWKNAKVITNDMFFGVNKIGYYTVRVTDEYGNMFMQSIKVDTCDKKAPKAPTISTYQADTVLVSGKAEKNSKVTVTINGKQYFCTASNQGTFKCPLTTKLKKDYIIEATSQDISGNVSEKTTTIVK